MEVVAWTRCIGLLQRRLDQGDVRAAVAVEVARGDRHGGGRIDHRDDILLRMTWDATRQGRQEQKYAAHEAAA